MRISDEVLRIAVQEGHGDTIVVPFARDLTEARVRIAALEDALRDAIEGMEDMICYVTPYFIEKWDHVGYIRRARAALAR
jgi:aspartate-semialdehyde dehydrogenase